MAQLFITTGQSTMLFVLLVFSVSLFDGLAKENLSGQLAQPQPNNFRSHFAVSNLVLGSSFFKTLVERLKFEGSQRTRPTIAIIPDEEIQEAVRLGEKYVDNWNQLEAADMSRQNRDVRKGYGRYLPEAIAQSKEAAVYLVARKHLNKKLGVLLDKVGDLNDQIFHLRQRPPATPNVQPCDFDSKFRNIDGSCNNRYRPHYGKAGTNLNRLFNSNQFYDDGVETIRKSKLTKSRLPGARLITATILGDDGASLNRDVTLLSTQFGQFLSHDLSHTPSFVRSDESPYDCCSAMTKDANVTSQHHPECLPISIPSDDSIYSHVPCMNFIRSTYGKDLDGSATPAGMRSQINSVTHWIDASNVYGSSIEKANELRDTTSGKGRMKTSVSSGHQMLPLGNTSFLSYQAGDDRVNQQPLLTVIHTIWLREHNRIAENMVRAVPGQTDEFYYQHARRLVIAEMQHIIYNEYLPVMIGPELAAQIMSPKYDYLDRGNPAVFNEFSTAAFRVGHSQLRSLVGIMEKDVHKVDRRLKFDLREPPNLSYLPPAVSANFTEQALHGLLGMLVQTGTPSQAYELIRTQHFQPKETAAPFDLISLNVQRGRDHGLPPYTKMLNYFDRNNVPSNFEELLPFIPEETVSAMRSVYESVDDIDLFVAGLIEKPLPDAMLGPTFSRIFAAQFLNLKRTDRFFYNYVDQSTGFRSNQLAEIQNVSLARIICDNSDGTITRIQPKVFRTPEEFNRLVSCDNFSELPGINFSKMLPL